MLKFTIFDIILLSIISFSTLLGGYKGAIKITFGFIVLIISILAIDTFSPFLETHLAKYIENTIILNIVTSALCFLISMFTFSLLSSKLTSLIKIPGLLDNFLGLMIGFIRGVAIVLVIFSLIIIFFSSSYVTAKNAHEVIHNVKDENYPEWLKESVSFSYLENAYRNVAALIPESYLKSINIPEKNEILEQLDEKKDINDSSKQNKLNDEFELENEDK